MTCSVSWRASRVRAKKKTTIPTFAYADREVIGRILDTGSAAEKDQLVEQCGVALNDADGLKEKLRGNLNWMLETGKPEYIRAAAGAFYFDALRFPKSYPAREYYYWKPGAALLKVAQSPEEIRIACHLMARAANGQKTAAENIVLALRAYGHLDQQNDELLRLTLKQATNPDPKVRESLAAILPHWAPEAREAQRALQSLAKDKVASVAAAASEGLKVRLPSEADMDLSRYALPTDVADQLKELVSQPSTAFLVPHFGDKIHLLRVCYHASSWTHSPKTQSVEFILKLKSTVPSELGPQPELIRVRLKENGQVFLIFDPISAKRRSSVRDTIFRSHSPRRVCLWKSHGHTASDCWSLRGPHGEGNHPRGRKNSG